MASARLPTAVLGFSLALLLQSLRAELNAERPLNIDRPWKALRIDNRRAALSGLPVSQRADALIHEAEIRSRRGDYAGAEQRLESALHLRRGDPDASFLLAQLIRDRPEQALRHAEQAARTAASARRRAAAYRLAGEIRLDLGDKAGAQSSLARALELAGDDLEALRVMVWIKRDEPGPAAAYAIRARRTAEALPFWQRAAAYRLCAQILLDIKDYSGAMASLRRALDIDPDDLNALRAMLQIKHQRPQEALPVAGKAPSDGRAAGGARIEEDLIRLLAADPDDLEALRALVAIKRAENRPAEAVSFAGRFTAAIRKSPPWLQPDAYRLNAQMWIELGKAEKAVVSLGLSKQLDSQSIATKRLFSRVPGIEDNWKQSLVSAYLISVSVRVELGDQAGAQESLKRALELCPDNVQILQSMVGLNLSQRKLEEALAYAERLVAASEKESPADIVKSRRTEDDILLVAARETGVPQDQAIELYLKDARAAESARRGLEKNRLMALQTMIQVQSALVKASEKAPPSERALER